mgnify:CR=1 FL=1
MSQADSARCEFWEERYQANATPWDTHGVPSPTLEFLRQTALSGSVLIPGCGPAYEVQAFHDFGWRCLAIDFAPTTVQKAQQRLGPLASCVRQADFFQDDLGGPFDLIHERTFLCALPISRRADYIKRVAQLLRRGGHLAGCFYYGEDMDGPPFPLATAEALSLFKAHFELLEDRPIPPAQSLPTFAGFERWQTWLRKPS